MAIEMLKATIISSFIILQIFSSTTTIAEQRIDAGQPDVLFKQAMAQLLGIKGQEKSAKTAFKKFEVLAQQGWKTAQHMLGNMYYKGEGISEDKVKAYIWYSLAARQNFGIAEEKVIYLRRHLEAKKIQEAEVLITAWENKHRV